MNQPFVTHSKYDLPPAKSVRKRRNLFSGSGFLLLLCCMLFAAPGNAQITITTPYPAAAQSLTRGLDTSLLTVEVNFLGACNSNIATITLAPGVRYVPGSVARTGGTTGFTIADLGGTANAPTFSIGGVTGAGSITFTIKRIAGCGSAASGKDVVSVTGSCGTVTENDVNVNAYNLLAPALAITAPPAFNNTVLGATASRTITVTNGGNGCLDTLLYYVVYPSGGIVNTNAGNAIAANGINFTPSSVSGDTLFYKISGTTVFGSDNLLCNGETVTITENIRVVKCNTNTSYGAAWGRSGTNGCQAATGASTMNMATGVAVPAANIASGSTYASPCTPGNKTWTIHNNGSGGNAGAMYNVILTFNSGSSKVTMSSAAVGSVPVTFAGTVANMTQVTSDPDGPGGLQDLDGDGQYDDLAPNDSFNINFDETWNCTATCPGNYTILYLVVVNYSTMCGTVLNSSPINPSSNFLNVLSSNSFTPAFITGGEAFPVRLCLTTGTSAPASVNYTTDSLYVKLTLPAGLAYAPGTATYNDVAVAAGDAFMVGSDLYIRKKSGVPKGGASYNFCIGMDLVYTCQPTNGALSIPYQVYNIRDNSCACNENLFCGTLTTTPMCPGGACPDGAANTLAQLTRKSLGWTNATLSTKVSAASLNSLSKTTLLPYDTFELKQSASGGAITYANLHYNFEIGKAGGQSTVAPAGGTVYFKRGATVFSCALPAVDSSASTGSISKYSWDLTTLFGTCFTGISDIQTGDSMAVIMQYVVTNANNGLLYGNTLTQAPDLNAYFYHLNGSNQTVSCGGGSFAMYLVGLNTTTNMTQNANSSACNPLTAISFQAKMTYGESLNIFPGEYRPQLAVDSFVITWNPAHYTYTASSPAVLGGSAYWFSNFVVNQNPNTSIVPTVNIPGKLVFANTSGTWPVSELARSTFLNAYSGIVTSGWMPTCATPNISNINFTAYYRGNYYTYPATLPQSSSAASSQKGYVVGTRPAITAQNNTGVVSGILPQHFWDVQITNASASTAPYVWMSFEKLAGSGIAIDSVVLQPSGQALTAMPYGAGSSWYQVADTGIASATSQQARVYFKYSNCQPDSVLFSTGWNCTGYPADPAAAQCGASSSQYLKVIPQSSQVQISMSHQPGNGGTLSLCSQDSVSVILNSAQAANLVNPNVVIYPPAGIALVSPISVEYPLGSGIWQNVTPVTISGGGYQINLSDHAGIGANGLPGTVLNPAADGRQAKINILFSTSCAFSSGSQLDFFVHGSKPCAAAAIGDGLDVKSNPVNIAGATTTGSAAISISMPAGTTLSCGDIRTLNLSVTELSTVTQSGDSVIYTLPAGLAYAGNFTGCASCGLNTQPGSGGTTLVKVSLPAGLASGTATNYSFDVTAAGAGGCTPSQINAQAERNIGGLSCGATTCATSRVVMGAATPMPVIINKPSITISSVTLVSGSWMPGTPTVAVTYQNTGAAAAPANTYISEYFCGSSTTPFATHTFVKPLVVNASATDTFVMTIPGAPACIDGDMITAKVQAVTASNTTQCICAPASYTLGAPLPVHFRELRAKAAGCNVHLYWSYEAINTQVAFFEIQRSEDGRNFSTLSRTDALANSYSDYTGRKGTWHYRILVSSTDGVRQYSDVLHAVTTCENVSDRLILYPNPSAKGKQVALDFTAERAYGPVVIRCTDIAGRVVLEQQATVVSGSNSFQLRTENLAPGAYQVSLYDERNRIAPPVKMVVTSK